MKRITMAISAIMIVALLLSGCSFKTGDQSGQGASDIEKSHGEMQGGKDMPGRENQGMINILPEGSMGRSPGEMQGGSGEFTEEERRQMMEERQQIAIDACNGKSEGEECEIGNDAGEISGTCKTRENTLSCVIEMPDMPAREQR